MNKMLTLLAVAAIPAMFGGCAACCPPGLCSCCPCNWFNRGAPCPPAPVYAAPLVAAPACPPAVAPMPQYVTPMAAPLAAAAPYPSPCATWNPCQGAVMAQPQAAAPCCPPQGMQPFQQQPMYAQPMYAQPAYYSEPGCGYVESSCGAPMTGMVSYGPEMPVEYGACGSGCCDGGIITPPAPEAFVTPGPAAE